VALCYMYRIQMRLLRNMLTTLMLHIHRLQIYVVAVVVAHYVQLELTLCYRLLLMLYYCYWCVSSDWSSVVRAR
jgi:hypothetical protein